MKTSEKILHYLSINTQATGKELFDYLDTITSRAVRKQLKRLFEEHKIRKIGKPPKVFYLLKSDIPETINPQIAFLDKKIKKMIDERYLFITPKGQLKLGLVGFVLWCKKTNQNLLKTSKEYVITLKKYDSFVKNGLISGMQKMKSTFPKVFIDKLFYLDFYSIERFGKTKLGQLLLHAKNGQDKHLIKLLVNEIEPQIVDLMKKYSIDGVVFIPPTVKREVQFMKELQKHLNLSVRLLDITKIKTDVIVAQKTLSKLSDRVENAKNTIIIEDIGRYNNILIIDDAVGSGSTLNETAAQIKKKKLCKGKIIGLAIVGSFKGFDVISEV